MAPMLKPWPFTVNDGVKDTSLKAKAEAKDSTLKTKAKTKDFKIVLEDPRRPSRTRTCPRGLQHCSITVDH